MKIVTLSTQGIGPAQAQAVTGQRGEYFALLHGEEGRGRWQIKLPLAAREFPSPADAGPSFTLAGEYRLVDLAREDSRGNPQSLIVPGEADGKTLVLWYLSPGYRGGASYRVEGHAEVIAKGEEAQGAAGRMGGAACPLVLVAGPCRLTWHRTGRLYSTASDWTADYDGEQWTIAPTDVCAAEEAALNY